MEFRRAQTGDFDKIVEMQVTNLDTNLSAESKKQGFLSGYFNHEQLAQANENMCVMVCLDGPIIAGFLCLTDVEFNRNLGMPGVLVQKLPEYSFQGRSLADLRSCLCGPVCIEESYRGQGLFSAMYERLGQFAPGCELAITAVSSLNPRSLRAHQKVGFQSLFEFEWQGNIFYCLIMPLASGA